jgi:type IV secretion system protein VirD4
MFLMDEFDQLGRQPLVLSSIKTIRGFGGRFFIISQTIPGLDDIYGETGRRSLQGGAGVQIYMTPQDDRTADVLSNALGRSTVTAVTESQSRIRALEDSANVSRRSEERPLISANELLRFPLDEVLVLPEGQYPIRARHVRYYDDRHFAPIDRARKSVVPNYVKYMEPSAGTPEVALMTRFIAHSDIGNSLGTAKVAFNNLSLAAKSRHPNKRRS